LSPRDPSYSLLSRAGDETVTREYQNERPTTDNSQCADITFSAAAVNPECVTNGVSVAIVDPASASSPAATVTVTAAASTPTSGAAEAFGSPSFGVAGALAAVIAVGFSALL